MLSLNLACLYIFVCLLVCLSLTRKFIFSNAYPLFFFSFLSVCFYLIISPFLCSLSSLSSLTLSHTHIHIIHNVIIHTNFHLHGRELYPTWLLKIPSQSETRKGQDFAFTAATRIFIMTDVPIFMTLALLTQLCFMAPAALWHCWHVRESNILC